MARSRNIKPGFFVNDKLADINPLGRLLFIGLWTLADREGRLEDRPRRIKAEVLPYDDCDADSLLDDLQKHGFIHRYEVGENRFIQVVNFNKHQNPHIKETASTIPAPELSDASDDLNKASEVPDEVIEDKGSQKTSIKSTVSDKHRTSTIQEQCKAQPKPERAGLIPDSGFLIPDTKNPPNPPRGESQKRERKERIQLKTFIQRCKTAGEAPISEYKPLLEYVDKTGLPMEFIQIAWDVFKREFLPPGQHAGRLQADWRRHFLNYVQKGYYRLWYAKQSDAGPMYELSTQGIQAQASLEVTA